MSGRMEDGTAPRGAAAVDLLVGMESRIAGVERSIGIILYAVSREQPSLAETMARMFSSASLRAASEGRHEHEVAVYEEAARTLSLPHDQPPAAGRDRAPKAAKSRPRAKA